MLIFAYGSNMNIDRLKVRTPSATKISNASIRGYKFKCNKVSNTGSSKGNIVFTNNPDDVVWGVIFNISDKEKAALDNAEGLGNGYNETKLTVRDSNDQEQLVQAYVADPAFINDNLLPFDWYKAFIVTGAEENALPKGYIDSLKECNATVDFDEARRKSNYDIINSKG